MTYLVTGTSGHLGRLVVQALLEHGVPASEIVAGARDTAKVADLAALGVTVRRADYDDPASLDAAFEGVHRALLVSSSEVGNRTAQHGNVVKAATAAGIELLAYTSILRADTSPLLLAADHQATERLLAESGLPVALLRNSWYVENWTAQIPVILEHGALAGAAGDGQVSAATRADYAAAAAVVLTSDDPAGVYELGGTPFTLAGFTAELAAQTGRDVAYRNLPVADYTQVLVGAGLPEPVAAVYADGDRGVRDGELLDTTGTLERLIGRPSTPLADAIRVALA
jgi:NAD(P)H dehydrogenase (quinone)